MTSPFLTMTTLDDDESLLSSDDAGPLLVPLSDERHLSHNVWDVTISLMLR